MLTRILRCRWSSLAATASSIALLSCGLAAAQDRDGDDAHRMKTATPIKHVIVLIGENWTFDSIYATYQPRNGQTVTNLLSNGIVTASGTPGQHHARSWQFQINQPYPATYFIDSLATSGKTLYQQGPATPSFPPPNTAYIPPSRGSPHAGPGSFRFNGRAELPAPDPRAVHRKGGSGAAAHRRQRLAHVYDRHARA